jgi:hypothetical protein
MTHLFISCKAVDDQVLRSMYTTIKNIRFNLADLQLDYGYFENTYNQIVYRKDEKLHSYLNKLTKLK